MRQAISLAPVNTSDVRILVLSLMARLVNGALHTWGFWFYSQARCTFVFCPLWISIATPPHKVTFSMGENHWPALGKWISIVNL